MRCDVCRRYAPFQMGDLGDVDDRTKVFSCSRCRAEAYLALIEPCRETGMHDYRLDVVDAPSGIRPRLSTGRPSPVARRSCRRRASMDKKPPHQPGSQTQTHPPGTLPGSRDNSMATGCRRAARAALSTRKCWALRSSPRGGDVGLSANGRTSARSAQAIARHTSYPASPSAEPRTSRLGSTRALRGGPSSERWTPAPDTQEVRTPPQQGSAETDPNRSERQSAAGKLG